MLRRHESTKLSPEHAEIIYNTLIELESALIDFRRDYGLLIASSQRRDASIGFLALTRVRGDLDAISSAILKLKQHTHDDDRTSDRGPIQSIGDLALRATKLLVTTLLVQLREALACDPDKARRMFGDQLRSMDDVSTYVLNPFEGASRLWTPFRESTSATELHDAEHHGQLRAVRASVAAMANAPVICVFLRAGVTSFDWPELGRLCARLSVVLRLDMEAAPSACSIDITTIESHETNHASHEP